MSKLGFLGRHLQFFAVLALASTSAVSPQAIAPGPPEVSKAVQSPPVTLIKKTVTFLKMQCLDGQTPLVSQGTGFFIDVPNQKGDRAVRYLVTNRHVAAPQYQGHDLRVVRTFVRLNLLAGGSAEELLPPSFRWMFPLDSAVDLAIMLLRPDESKADYLAIPSSMFASSTVISSEQITEGQSVFFTGFFMQYPGEKRLEPIVRQGILAMLPDESLHSGNGASVNLYLADVHAFRGNSGSPMFTDLAGVRNGELRFGHRYLLLGVVNGFIPEDAPFRAEMSSTLDGKIETNSGIATVVPADELLKFLNEPAVKSQREAIFAAEAHNPK